MEIQNGLDTSFWYDQWSPLGRIYDLLGDRGFIDLGICAEASVADALTARRRRRHRLAILNQIEEELNHLREPRPLEPDVALWRNAAAQFKSTFSTSETWSQIRHQGIVNNWHKGIWFSGATPKYSFILWLAAHNRLSTGDRMLCWNTGTVPSCVFCLNPLESRDHLFFSCSFTSRIWSTFTRKLLGPQFTTVFSEILVCINDAVFTRSQQFLLRYVFQTVVYTLWQERNNRRHGAAPLPTDHHVAAIDRIVRNRIISFKRLHPHKLQDVFSIWLNALN